ncbi:MAG: capsid protein, partial [Clostridia bacterium]
MPNYAQQYQQTLANAFPKVLHFGALWNNTNKGLYKADEAHANTIYLPTVTTTGRVNGARGKIGTATVRHNNEWEAKTLTNHRTWDTLVHPQDINQTNMVATLQNITKAFNEQQKFKEMDCYLSSKIYTDWKALSGKAASTLVMTKDNILSYIDSVMAAMDEADVPQEGRILYCTTTMDTLIKNAK